MDYPNVLRLCQDFEVRNIILLPPYNVSIASAWIEWAKQFAQPCHDYFFKTVMGDKNVKLYKAIQLTNPDFFHQDQSWKTGADLAASTRNYLVPLVKDYCLISPATMDCLIQELSKYSGCCTRERIDFAGQNIPVILKCITSFWDKYKTTLPAWYDFATLCMLLQPSSASVERVFSILKSAFGDFQTSSLHDKVQLQVQLIYNND